MRKVLRVLRVLMVAGLGAYAVAGEGALTLVPNARAATPKMNACGCYRDAAGGCFCGKKSKCECPGDCEPQGCDEKRAKQMDKEMEAEAKRARDAEKKQRDAEAERRKKSEAVNNDEETAAEARLQAAEAEASQDGDAEVKKGKKGKKGSKGNKGNVDKESQANDSASGKGTP